MTTTDTEAKLAKGTQSISEVTSTGASLISAELRVLLADVFAIYLKIKNFHWHMRGSHFRDYHLLLDEQAVQVFAMTDVIAERTRKLGETALHSIGDIAQYQRIEDNNEPMVPPEKMLKELLADNRSLVSHLRSAHELCAAKNDFATTSLIENWIDETEHRCWFLAEVITETV